MPQNPLSKEQLRYYFDIQHRDALDRGSSHRRSADIQTIREHLMHLPEQAFDHTVQNIKNLLSAQRSNYSNSKSQDGELRKEAFDQLFNPIVPGSSGSQNVSSVSQTQKV